MFSRFLFSARVTSAGSADLHLERERTNMYAHVPEECEAARDVSTRTSSAEATFVDFLRFSALKNPSENLQESSNGPVSDQPGPCVTGNCRVISVDLTRVHNLVNLLRPKHQNKRTDTVLEPGRLEDDGQVKQPVRLLPVLEAANPGAGPVGAGGPGPDGGAGPERRREGPFLPGGGGLPVPVYFLHLLASSSRRRRLSAGWSQPAAVTPPRVTS
ncbi:hypothetical protein fugu_018082 [Takifugu bimaculatus]|uniref:Uncharacterized protein n=1 Tax=Takifugu bimaculatus TaxID=433685 RepID=A0A4Z2BN51_9TELE|nr:hypothetical protein fugu_018082 [Takifugu bimaculatus]